MAGIPAKPRDDMSGGSSPARRDIAPPQDQYPRYASTVSSRSTLATASDIPASQTRGYFQLPRSPTNVAFNPFVPSTLMVTAHLNPQPPPAELIRASVIARVSFLEDALDTVMPEAVSFSARSSMAASVHCERLP